MRILLLMSNATPMLPVLVEELTADARRRGLTDSQWARLAGLRKESLSRLRSRKDCDFATLEVLARAVGARLGATSAPPLVATADGHMPARLTRDAEDALLELANSGDLAPQRWQQAGPRFFMAGFATLLASLRGFERPALLALAERLHPGMSAPTVFSLWLGRSPLRPARFVPQLEAQRRHAA